MSEQTSSSEIVPVTYDDVFGTKPADADLSALVAAWPLIPALDFLGRLGCLMRFGVIDYRKAEFQRELVNRLKLGSYKAHLLRMIGGSRVFVFPEQLAILIKYVLRHSVGSAWPPGFEDEFARSILIVSYLRTTATTVSGIAAPTAADFIPVEIAGMFGFEDPYVNKLLLFASFFKWTLTDEARSHPAASDASDDFKASFGISWLEYMAVGYGLLMFFKQINTFERLSRYSFLLTPAYIERFKYPDQVARWLELNSTDLKPLVNEITTRWSNTNLGASLFPLKQQPFIRFDDNTRCCPYVQFLENASSSGLFYRLADAYRIQDLKKSRNLRTWFGHFLETYVLSIFKRVAAVRGYGIEGDKTYRVGNQERHGADVEFTSGSDVAFVEVTSTRFREIDTLIELRDEFIEEDVERLISKIRELNSDIQDFKAGHLTYEGINPAAVARIFPLVVTSFSVPHFVGIVSVIRDTIATEGLLLGAQPVELVEVQALDLLESDMTSSISPFELLLAKQERTASKPTSLMNFVALRGRELGLRDKMQKPQALIEIETELRDLFNSWGGPQIVPPRRIANPRLSTG